MRKILTVLCLVGATSVFAAGGSKIPLDKAPIDRTDFASMQRGAKLFVNRCYACHSLQYMRYDSLAKGIMIVDEEGEVLEDVVKNSLMFVGDKLSSPMEIAMSKEKSAAWFGAAPPDLSLISRSRGVDYLYTYLRTFYRDDARTFGVNNVAYEAVGMPNVLEDLQGVQVMENGKLKLVKPGELSVEEFDEVIADLVNFLSYVGEPVQVERERLGVFVILFLGILYVLSFLLKREYWKEVK